MKLETKRLYLRPLILSDKDALFAYRSDAETNKYQGWIPKSREEVEAFIGRIPHQINRPETWFQLAIVEKETQQLIGDVGIHFMDKANLQAEVGCTIDKRYQNKGYATEALVRVLDYLFGELQKHRVTASIDPENTGSIRLVERIGFRKEAHFVESLFIHGKWVDDLIYALIEKDWEALNA